ncbi:hypothetical protein MTR67_019370 [Solanum verrucosum]|uniref:Cytochrome P450 n=1 Tax=Solanum verrucosum TaxID=315347 RepID=A0AAF0QP19_SOLVR|nr:hypothetical protein MTR67_019370 [Solanum verrucosum]
MRTRYYVPAEFRFQPKLGSAITVPARSPIPAHQSPAYVVVEDVINEHKKNIAIGKTNGALGCEDLTDVFIRLMNDGGLQFPITNDNIKAIIFDMFAAGTETSSSMLVWAMVPMMKNPSVFAKAQAEVQEAFKDKETFDENYVEEHLKDPKYWDDAESFKPERFEQCSVDFIGNNFEYLPFGGGRRICFRISFGLANVYLPLAQLLYHFDWKLPNRMEPKDLNLTELVGVTAARKHDLILVATPYQLPRQ